LHLISLKPATAYKIKAYKKLENGLGGDRLILTSFPLRLANALKFPQDILAMIAYIKASNTGAGDRFGGSVALSADGVTLAVGAYWEDGGGSSNDCGLGPNLPRPNLASNCEAMSGAVYVFEKASQDWLQQAYLKSSNTETGDDFGYSLALSADGQTLAIGAEGEDGGGPNNDCGLVPSLTLPNPASNCETNSGAVYVFEKNVTGGWQQQTYIKASNAEAGDNFGVTVALSSDGETLMVGAVREDGGGLGNDCSLGTNPSLPNPGSNCKIDSGAFYVFAANATAGWQQQAYLKASNTGAEDWFGHSIALSADGQTLVVGASSEDGGGPNNDCGLVPSAPLPNPASNCEIDSGAVYVFTDNVTVGWQQQTYLKASNTGTKDWFGYSVALSADGQTLAVGANGEDGGGSINDCGLVTGSSLPNPTSNCEAQSGAVYVFARTSQDWLQQVYLKASNTGPGDWFGYSVALNTDGQTLVVGARLEDGAIAGVNFRVDLDPTTATLGDSGDNADYSGAAYLFGRVVNGTWQKQPLAYIKASNTEASDNFGWAVAISADGKTLAVGAIGEAGGGAADNCILNGQAPLPSQETNCQQLSGAVYVY